MAPKLPTKKAIDAARNRIAARKSGMDEAEIYRRFPRPAPPLADRVKTAAAAATQLVRDLVGDAKVLATRDAVRLRKSECNICEFYHRGTCQKCGCLIPLKVNLARATCPIGRWNRDPVSVLIPARNELYLFRTILDLQTNAAGPIDIWIFADSWNDHRDVLDRVLAMDSNSVHVVVNDGPAVGIRRASNHLADLAPGPYLYRVDAHCAFSPAWDIALKNAADPKTVVVPAMRILDPVAWTAERGGGNYYYIDQDFRYKTLPGVRAKAAVVEIMVFIGAAWFCRKTTWQALGGYDDRFYKWGESGVEWSLKTWLNGGRLVLDRRSWFAHWFRGKFPYAISGKKIESNRTAIREYYQNYHGERSVKWLVRKFKPLPGWHFEATPEGTPENGSKTQ